MVPYKLKVPTKRLHKELHFSVSGLQFDPESLHMCTKLSGEAVQFSRREKFDSIVQHLTARYSVLVLVVAYMTTVQGAHEDE